MRSPGPTLKQENTKTLPSAEEAFAWPHQSEKNNNWKEATERWAILRKAYPNHPSVWTYAAKIHIEAAEPEKAANLLDYALKHFPKEPEVLIQSAALAMYHKDWETADTYLQAARGRFPEYLQTWLKSAELAEHLDDTQQAYDFNKTALECAPEHPAAYIQRAEIATHANRLHDALEYWSHVRELFPNKSEGYTRAADVARDLGQLKEARKLTLAQQYGNHILENNDTEHKTKKPEGRNNNYRRFLELVWTKAIFNLRSEVHHNYLSYGWWVLEPLLHMIVYYVVFGLLLKRGGENFPVFLLTGLVPWMWFMKTVSGSSNSIIAGKNLMLQVGLPSITFPLINIIQSSLKQLPVFILLFGFIWLQGYSPNSYWWFLIPVIFVEAILIVAFSCLVAAIIPFIRDLSYLVPTGLAFTMFLSGIFYDYRTISPDWQSLFLLNPVAFLLKCYREILMEKTQPDLVTLSLWGIGGITACVILVFAYQRLRYIYPRVVLQ